jgi:hypothetical protein
LPEVHPIGLRPFVRAGYIRKFQTLTEDLISREESCAPMNSTRSILSCRLDG